MPTTITPNIVNLQATVVSAPQPSLLQQSVALISVGGSTLSANTYQYCGTLAAAQALLSATGNFVELGNMATTYFAQSSASSSPVGVYILELGTQASASAGIAALTSWLTANPGVFYAFLTPANWDTAQTAFNTLAASYSSPTGRTYFVATTTSGTISGYTATNKAIIPVVASPTAGAGEFQAAVFLFQLAVNNPSAANPAAPMNFRYAYGVTPWVLTNNSTTINNILTANGNLILTGAEGGISTAVIRNGTTIDGNQIMFWYAVDYVQIQSKLQLAAAIINGSNSNPPLQYNQAGINQLLAVIVDIIADGVSFGLLLTGTAAATPFLAYTNANPSNYAKGLYGGFSAVVTPQLGFTQISFFIEALQFA